MGRMLVGAMVMLVVSCGKKEPAVEPVRKATTAANQPGETRASPPAAAPAAARSPEYAGLREACEKGGGKACWQFGYGVLEGEPGAPRDLSLAGSLLERGCEQLRFDMACGSLARAHETGILSGGNPDLQRS